MAKKRKVKDRKAASLTVYGIGRMTKRGRKDIAKWLSNLASEIANNGDAYTEGRFRAGFHYR